MKITTKTIWLSLLILIGVTAACILLRWIQVDRGQRLWSSVTEVQTLNTSGSRVLLELTIFSRPVRITPPDLIVSTDQNIYICRIRRIIKHASWTPAVVAWESSYSYSDAEFAPSKEDGLVEFVKSDEYPGARPSKVSFYLDNVEINCQLKESHGLTGVVWSVKE